MTDLSNVRPVNEGGKTTDEDDQPDLRPAAPEDTPAPSNAERAASAAAKAEAEKAKAAAPQDDAETPDDVDTQEREGEAELDTEVWGEYTDEVTNSVLTILQNSEIAPDTAKALLWDAVESGDPSRIDRDKLVETLGKAKATLVLAGIENVIDRNKRIIAETTKVVVGVAGSEANWKKAREWAVKTLSEDELGDYVDMLDAGGNKAKYAATQIIEQYNADPKNTALNAGQGQVTGDGKAETKIKGISRREYGEQLMKLERRGATPAEFRALSAQRAAGKKQGI